MKRRTFVAAMPISLAAVHLTSTAAEPQLIVATETDDKPFVFLKDGKFRGFSYDVWVQIAKEMGVAYQLRPMDFSALIPALQTKNVDVAFASIYITAARKKVVDFSDPYYQESSGVLVRAGSPIKKLKDLTGKQVATVTGTAQVAWAKANLTGTSQMQFPNLAEALLALRTSRVDGVIYDAPTLAYYATTEGRGKVAMLPERAGEAFPVGFAFPKGSPLVARTNAALKKIRDDRRYLALTTKWFGSDQA